MKRAPIPYSQQELGFIKTNCTLVVSDLTQKFNLKFDRNVSVTNINALRKRKKWRTGRTGHFEKGHIPHPNARPKGPNPTSFKKGHKPVNYLPVGTERVSTDGYVEIKMAEGINKWRSKARIIWAQVHGELKESEILRFKDGKRLNCQLSNLEKVNRSEHARLNQMEYNAMPEEVKPVILTLARLQAKAGELEKSREGNKC